MILHPCCKLALIVEPDLGFLMWLGEVFTDAGYQPVPALHCSGALTLARGFERPIAVLAIHPELRGAAHLLKTVRAAYPHARIIFIEDRAESSSAINGRARLLRSMCNLQPVLTLERPAVSEPVTRDEWVAKVRKLLASPHRVASNTL